MIEQTQWPVVAVADHSKVGTVAEVAIAPIERVACLVTDDAIDEDYRGALEERGIRVIAGTQIPAGSRSGG
jgi:DeoR/GlpR family transcriptional regulator of sugar metabolism